MTVIIDGKQLAAKIKEDIKQEVATLSSKPGIVVIIVGEDPSSKIYVRNKKEAAAAIGMNSSAIEYPETVSQQELEQKIEELNQDKSVNAVLVQMPLPKHLNSFDILQKICPKKDVDGFHPENVGKLSIGIKPYAKSCTPKGVIELLETYNIDIEGKHAVIIGRSNIVGKPLASLLLNKNATVTICHSKTKDIQKITREADILISAVGKPKMVKADWVKEGAVIVDVGITRDENNKLSGDVDFETVKNKASFITPVPGGVGPMTIAMLLKNTLELYKLQNN